MGDENMRVVGNARPDFSERFSSRQVEGPLAEFGLPRASVDLDTFHLNALVLEITHIAQGFSSFLLGQFERPIVVARDHDLVGMRESLKKPTESSNLVERPPSAHVAGEEQDVSIGHLHLMMKVVAITQDYKSHGRSFRRELGLDLEGSSLHRPEALVRVWSNIFTPRSINSRDWRNHEQKSQRRDHHLA